MNCFAARPGGDKHGCTRNLQHKATTCALQGLGTDLRADGAGELHETEHADHQSQEKGAGVRADDLESRGDTHSDRQEPPGPLYAALVTRHAQMDRRSLDLVYRHVTISLQR